MNYNQERPKHTIVIALLAFLVPHPSSYITNYLYRYMYAGDSSLSPPAVLLCVYGPRESAQGIQEKVPGVE